MQLSKDTLIVIIGSVFIFGFSSCKENLNPSSPNPYFTPPSHFPELVYNNDANQLTAEKVNLGKELFFDPILSLDSSISCGSCHQIAYAMSDRNRKLSFGVENQLGNRNTPALFNLAWQEHFMWDGGVNHIEFVPVAPIENPVEMKLDFVDAIDRINKNEYYKSEFNRLFNVDQISDREFLFSVSQFMALLVSAESKYDDVVVGKATFTPNEQKGYNLYKSNCAECHAEPLFTIVGFRNNGLDSTFQDIGRQRITTNKVDKGKFKIPSLRNLAYTYPYMHDGRFNSLHQVLNHYSEGIQSSVETPADVSNMNFTEEEKQSILAFLATLNDEKFVTNKLFQP